MNNIEINRSKTDEVDGGSSIFERGGGQSSGLGAEPSMGSRSKAPHGVRGQSPLEIGSWIGAPETEQFC